MIIFRFLMITILIFTISLGCSRGEKADEQGKKKEDGWVLYKKSNDGSQRYYHKQSIKKVGQDVVRVWEKNKYSKFTKDSIIQDRTNRKESVSGFDKLDNVMFLWELDCNTNLYKCLKFIVYDSEGKKLAGEDYTEPDIESRIPNQNPDLLFITVCPR
jgi:hypothetical protein